MLPTSLRVNPVYVTVYLTYTNLAVLGILPFFLLLLLNTKETDSNSEFRTKLNNHSYLLATLQYSDDDGDVRSTCASSSWRRCGGVWRGGGSATGRSATPRSVWSSPGSSSSATASAGCPTSGNSDRPAPTRYGNKLSYNSPLSPAARPALAGLGLPHHTALPPSHCAQLLRHRLQYHIVREHVLIDLSHYHCDR